jgi:aminoglycoside phosphotransferase (APT) family kinase protein
MALSSGLSGVLGRLCGHQCDDKLDGRRCSCDMSKGMSRDLLHVHGLPGTEAEQPCAETLGTDAVAWLQSRGFVVEQADEVSTLRSPRLTVQAYALRLRGGGRLKLRRFRDARRAQVVRNLMQRAHDARLGIARVVDAFEHFLLLEWVDGAAIGAPSEAVLRECGAWLAALHAVPVDADLRESAFAADAAQAYQALTGHCELLTHAQVMPSELASQALERARAQFPQRSGSGSVVCHGDFCEPNLLLSTRGQPISIDNANMHVGIPELDIARTFARWPLDAEQREAWLSGYLRHRELSTFLPHVDFWMCCGLAASAATRVRLAVDGAPSLVSRMQRLLAGDGSWS